MREAGRERRDERNGGQGTDAELKGMRRRRGWGWGNAELKGPEGGGRADGYGVGGGT